MTFIPPFGRHNYYVKRLGISLVSTAAVMALGDAPASARVGVTSVVEGEPKGQPPALPERILRVGIDMNADEKVTTGPTDRAHLVFNDGTSLTIGPSSVIIIDKYLYDPNQKTGEMGLKLSRGTLRFVGGVISKNSEVKINTPSASMGIRGGILTVAIAPSGATKADFLFGLSFSITSQGVTQTTTQPGTEVTVTPGQPPPPPIPIPPGSLTNDAASFEQGAGTPNGTAGPPRGPTGRSAIPSPGNSNAPNTRPGALIRSALANAGLSQINSAMAPQAAAAATPSPQQIASLLTAPSPTTDSAAQDNGSGPPNQQARAGDGLGGTGPLGDGAPLQGAGPLSASGPLEGGNPWQGGGPLQIAGPLQGAGVLLGAGPLLGDGPLQGTAALLGAGPLQAAAPLLSDGGAQASGPLAPAIPQSQNTASTPLLLASLPAALLTATPAAPGTPVAPSVTPDTTSPSSTTTSQQSTTAGFTPTPPTPPPSDPGPLPIYSTPQPAPTPVNNSSGNVCTMVSCN